MRLTSPLLCLSLLAGPLAVAAAEADGRHLRRHLASAEPSSSSVALASNGAKVNPWDLPDHEHHPDDHKFNMTGHASAASAFNTSANTTANATATAIATPLPPAPASKVEEAVATPTGVKESGPWDEPDTPDSNGENKAVESNGDKAADLTTTVTLPTDATVAVGGAKESDPWDEPDSEDGRANGNKAVVAVDVGEEGAKDGRGNGRGNGGWNGNGNGNGNGAWDNNRGNNGWNGNNNNNGWNGNNNNGWNGNNNNGWNGNNNNNPGWNRGNWNDYNDNGWRYGGDRRFDRCVRFCQQHCYQTGKYQYCPNRCYGWCHRQLGY